MSQIVVHGCGDLAWGRPSSSALFGRGWMRGRIADRVAVTADGGSGGMADDWVRLAEELDRQVASSAAPQALAPMPVEVQRTTGEGPPPGGLLLPWSRLVADQADSVTHELGGAGVLVTPGHWWLLEAGRQLLEAWAAAGWSWAPLETVLERRFPGRPRCVSASGSWLRIADPEGPLTFANGDDAARAQAAAVEVLALARQTLGADLGARYQQEEESASAWFTHHVVVRSVIAAMAARQPRIELGAGAATLFRFSTAEGAERYRSLNSLRFAIALPLVRSVWWKRLTEPDFLQKPDGAPYPGIAWEGRSTVLLEGPAASHIFSFLAFRGVPLEQIDPASLEEAADLGTALPHPSPSHSAPQEAPEPSAAAAPGALPAPPMAALPVASPLAAPTAPTSAPAAPTAAASSPAALAAAASPTAAPVNPIFDLEDFVPNQISLPPEHRPGRILVWLDGAAVDPRRLHQAGRPGLYTIDGVIAHGAIVRVDYETPTS